MRGIGPAPRRLDFVALVFAGLTLRVAQSDEADTCPAGTVCDGRYSRTDSYYWPTAMGSPKHYGNVPFPGPFDLKKSVAWYWHHPDGEFNDMPLGTSIDDKKNVYVVADRGIYKLDENGKLVWRFNPPPIPGRADSVNGHIFPNGPTLWEGALYATTTGGVIYAIDMATGRVIWEKKFAPNTCYDTGYTAVYDGVIIDETDSADGFGKCMALRGVNATTGEEIWKFEPDNPVWDLMVQFPQDGSFIFQDITGRAYRNNLKDGTVIWKNGGFPNSWTDGTQGLGPNGDVYAVNTHACDGPNCHGWLTAYDLKDGKQKWQVDVPRPPNSSPTAGILGGSDKPAVVIPIGQQPHCEQLAQMAWFRFPFLQQLPQEWQTQLYAWLHSLTLKLGDYQQYLWGKDWVPDLPTDVLAFDAETGALRWKWAGPTYRRFQCPGDEKGFWVRAILGYRKASCPTPWSAPRIGADGTVYVGNQNGFFFAINDFNGDGKIDDATEVSSFDCEAEFSSAGSAHAPGMIVAASAVKVWAWKS